MSNERSIAGERNCLVCGKGFRPRSSHHVLCSEECQRAQKTGKQYIQRKAARQAQGALRPVRSPLVFEWAFNLVHDVLRRMRGLEFTQNTTPEPAILSRLLESSPGAVRLLVNESQWLRGNGDGRGNVLGSYLWEHPDFFVKIGANRRLRTHEKHWDERLDFLARAIAAEIAGYAMSAGDGHLAHLIARCRDCKGVAVIDRNICLHRNVRPGELGCPDCLLCVHPNVELGDQVCPNCGAEVTYLANALWELCSQITLISLGLMRPHSSDECGDSTYACLAHDPVPGDSRRQRAWCMCC